MIQQIIIFQANPAGSIMQFVPMIAIFAVIYFFFIRPQAKKQKEQELFVKGLDKGMEVVTTSGIIGKINKVEDTTISLQLDQKTFVKMLKSSVSKEMTESMNS